MIAKPHRLALSMFGGVIALWLVAMLLLMRASALPPDTTGKMLAVFDPGISAEAAFAAVTRAGAKPVRQTSFPFIWVVEGNAAALEAAGALGTYKDLPISPMITGCIAVVDAKTANAFGL